MRIDFYFGEGSWTEGDWAKFGGFGHGESGLLLRGNVQGEIQR